MERKIRISKRMGVVVFVALLIVFGLSLSTNAAETLKIGVLVPLTGPTAEGGMLILKAVELATSEINQSGGVLGRKIELVVWDDEGKVEKGLTGAKKLILQDNVWGLIGGWRSGVVLAIQDILAEHKKIFMVTTAASNEITRRVKQDYNKYKYTFRSIVSVDQMPQLMLPYLTDVVKAKTYFYVSENSQWSKELAEAVKKLAEAKGIKRVGYVECDPNATDFTSEIMKIKGTAHDAVLSSLTATPASAFAKQYYDLKAEKPLCHHSGSIAKERVVREMGEKANYQMVCVFCWDIPLTPKTQGFYGRFTKFYTRPSGWEDTRSYDGMYVLVEGIKKAGSLDVEKVITALEKTDYVGVAGRYVFDEEHQCKWGKGLLEGVIVQWINGYNVLYPLDRATSKYTPAPWYR